MKKNVLVYYTIILFCCLGALQLQAQISVEQMQQYIVANKFPSSIDTKTAADICYFYETIHYNTAWIQKENIVNKLTLINELKNAPLLGLKQKDYPFDLLENNTDLNKALLSKNDSIDNEVMLTYAALHFYNDIVYGNAKPSVGFNGLEETLDCKQIPVLLAEYIAKHKLELLASDLHSSLAEIKAVENKIKWISSIINNPDFKEVVVSSTKVNYTNTALVTKLYQLGITNQANEYLKDTSLVSKVKEAQKQFVLISDGKIRTTLLEELNVPLSKRLAELQIAINYYRWLSCFSQYRSTIVVNIPAAYLKVYRNNEVLLEMRIIVGKKTTPTPTLLSTVNEVILYPYWHVPYSIATKELLPRIKQSASYIENGNYQVLNKDGKIVDPYSINWHALSASNFPYIIRQSTGCDNALGLLKLNFYSPDGVYLHDTPDKNLFALNKRYFSHGCMRMEKPMEMGHFILKNNFIAIDTLTQKGCIRNQSPITVHADVHMPILVWYNPVGIDSAGRVLFYEDVYGKFKYIK